MGDYEKWCEDNPILAEIEQIENLGSIDGILSPDDELRLNELYNDRCKYDIQRCKPVF